MAELVVQVIEKVASCTAPYSSRGRGTVGCSALQTSLCSLKGAASCGLDMLRRAAIC